MKVIACNLPGWPDCQVFGKNGKHFFIEMKVPGNTPEPLQEYYHNTLGLRGFDVFVCDDPKHLPYLDYTPVK
jgi:hypothetical protein